MPYNNRQGEILSQSAGLTRELAKTNQDLYKARLISNFGSNGFGGESLKNWKATMARFGVTEKDITLKPDTWISKTVNHKIELGIGNLPADLRERFLFEDDIFDDLREIQYRLSHEICHTVAWWASKNDKSVGVFISTLKQMRLNGVGFSSLGGIDFYKSQGPLIQTTEDITEIFNMYAWSPEYFERYLKFLSDKKFAQERKRFDLVTINANTIQAVFEIIQKASKEYQNS